MITDKSREEVIRLTQQGELNIKAPVHYDICKGRQEGRTATALAKEFNISPNHVYRIQRQKCPHCP